MCVLASQKHPGKHARRRGKSYAHGIVIIRVARGIHRIARRKRRSKTRPYCQRSHTRSYSRPVCGNETKI